jgi:hypothetical protein
MDVMQFYGPTPHTKQTILPFLSENGKCMDVPDGNATNGNRIFIWVSAIHEPGLD